jgi:N-acetylmuramoyl-L-alanine amidase
MTGFSRSSRRLITALMMMGLLLYGLGPMPDISAQEAAAEVDIRLDGEAVELASPIVIVDDRLYAPAARIAELFGASAVWDSENEEITIHTALNDTIILGNGVPVVYFNEARYRMDALPFLKDGRVYAPLRQLAEMLHASVQVNPETKAIELTTVEAAAVTAENGLEAITAQFGSSKQALLSRNGIAGESALASDAKLKVVIPSIFDHPAEPFTDTELMLLAKITMVEAGYEGYEGQLAVANVIMNRVKDSRFPDTIKGVIYAGKQFPPAHNGLLDKSKPNASSLRAAKDALNGKNNVEDAVYFFNPKVSRGPFWSSMDVVATIGHHSFAR